MQHLVPLMKVHIELTVKTVHNGPMPNKTLPSKWASLAWDGGEKKLQDLLPVHPCVSCMCTELFDHKTRTPLQKLMAAINRRSCSVATKKQLTKKELVESLDESILKIENERMRIECFEES
jgi:hypothetical protein